MAAREGLAPLDQSSIDAELAEAAAQLGKEVLHTVIRFKLGLRVPLQHVYPYSYPCAHQVLGPGHRLIGSCHAAGKGVSRDPG